jgi:hypothetical protein
MSRLGLGERWLSKDLGGRALLGGSYVGAVALLGSGMADTIVRDC